MVDLPPSPTFYQVPEELLVIIMEYILQEKSTYWRILTEFPTLKNLRLSCRQYAYMPRLLSILFQGIRLVASPSHLQIVETTDLSPLKPYVKKIVFEPTKYAWTMTRDLFEGIVFITPLGNVIHEWNIKHREEILKIGSKDFKYLSNSDIDKHGHLAFIEKYGDGKAPFSDEEVEEGYERYMAHAKPTKEIFETGKLKRAWTHALKQLPDVGTFRIGFWDFENTPALGERLETKGRDWRDLGCEIYEHQHSLGSTGHSLNICRTLQEPVSEALFRTAIASLIGASSRITKLTIKSIDDGNYVWADDGQLNGLDLSHLQHLKFHPQAESDSLSTARKAEVEARCGLAFTALLKKSASSILTLSLLPVVPSSPISFPIPPISPLPCLTSFRTGVTLHLAHFSFFLLASPSLTSLTLDDCYVCHDSGQWRDVWRAIRHHPSRMRLYFNQILCNNMVEISLVHWTGEASKGWQKGIGRSLEMYLSGRGRWDRTCRKWFPGEDSEASDGEGDEDDDEGDGDDGDDDSGDTEDDDNDREEDEEREDEMQE